MVDKHKIANSCAGELFANQRADPSEPDDANPQTLKRSLARLPERSDLTVILRRSSLIRRQDWRNQIDAPRVPTVDSYSHHGFESSTFEPSTSNGCRSDYKTRRRQAG